MQDFLHRVRILRSAVPVLTALAMVCSACGSEPAPSGTSDDDNKSAEKAPADTSPDELTPVEKIAARPSIDLPDAHPLEPAIRLAQDCLAHIDRDIKDYSCLLVKQQRVDGELLPVEHIYTKVRHEPFSVYMKFKGPKELKGRECLYVEGKYDNKLIAHEGSGSVMTMTVYLDPTGYLAMRGQKYPITEVGVRNLTARLIEVAKSDVQAGDCEVSFHDSKLAYKQKGKKVVRPCTSIEVIHPERGPQHSFHKAHIFIDKELKVPVYYAGYLWPAEPDGEPQLDESYTYLDLKINNGFTDKDFDPENSDYDF